MGILEYCSKKRSIVCYGAGMFGKITCLFLQEKNIKISYFGVTNKPKIKMIFDINVKRIVEIPNITDNNTGVILCGNSKIIPEMIKYAKKIGIHDFYVVNEELLSQIDESMDYSKSYHDKQKHILLYHRIGNADFDIWNMFTSPKVFREQLMYLKSEYNIVKLEDIDFNISKEQLAITFDDGYLDSFSEAMEIINECKVPVTIFVSTQNIGNKNEFWWDVIEQTIFNPNCPSFLDWNNKKYDLTTDKNKTEFCWRIRDRILQVNSLKRQKLIERLIESAGVEIRNRETYRTINRDEIAILDKCPWITIGAHSVTHTRLSSETLEEVEFEMRESKSTLETILGHEVSLMSFPFGCLDDYNEEIINEAKKAGFKMVAAVQSKYQTKDLRLFNVPRISISANNNSMDGVKIINKLLALDNCCS